MADQGKMHGEAVTGYEGPEDGPFKCSNCEYFKNKSCGQQTMMDNSKLPKTENGRIVVSPDGCCAFFSVKRKLSKGHWMAGKR